MRPHELSDSYGLGSINRSPSRYHEEEKFTRSPARSPLRESRFTGTASSVGGFLQAPTSSYRPTSSPSRSTYDLPRESHSSPIRPRAEVTRDLLSRS